MYGCILFDIDNTLLLKKPSIVEKVFQAAQPSLPGLPLSAVEKAYAQSELWQGEQIRKENETGVRMSDEDYLRHVFSVYQQALGLEDALYGPLSQIFMRDYHMGYELAPGAKESLQALQAQGAQLGIVSNNTSSVRQALADSGIAGFFGAVVISQEVELYKPDPQILELACAQLGASCADSVYVGDHPFDILCAHAAHMAAAWLPANQYMSIPAYIGAPEFTAHSLQEAAGLLLAHSSH